MIKVIYIYWAQKFINAPNVVKKCLLSWKLKNPTWKIIELDNENLCEYINIEKEIPDIKNKNITKTAYSDIVRLFLLAKYGGCWCDATTFCNISLDNWLYKNISTGFFGFNKPSFRKGKQLCTWFLYSEKDNYIIQKWKQKTIIYWKNHNKMIHYFWVFFLFNNLYNSNNKFKKMFDLTPKICGRRGGPHYVRGKLLKNLSDNVKNHIDQKKTPLYKLTYKYNEKKYNKKCNLSYLLNTINLKFIHIPKTAGTSIENAAKHNNLLWGRFDKSLKGSKMIDPWHLPQKINSYCFCVMRDPFTRFISQFYHDNKIEDYNSEKLNKYIEKKIPQIKKNILVENNHFLHQYIFYETCNIIISFDDLQNNLNKLMKLFNLSNLILENDHCKHQQKKRNKNNINRLTYDNINEKNRKLIKNFYKFDFDLYNNVKKQGILIKP